MTVRPGPGIPTVTALSKNAGIFRKALTRPPAPAPPLLHPAQQESQLTKESRKQPAGVSVLRQSGVEVLMRGQQSSPPALTYHRCLHGEPGPLI